MKYKTTKEIVTMFYLEDKKTIVRQPNLRRFVMQENIPAIKNQNGWKIDEDALLAVLNPKGIVKHEYAIPRIRTIAGCVREWNKTHHRKNLKIDKHIIEKAMKDDKVFKTRVITYWMINYDQIEQIIMEKIK